MATDPRRKEALSELTDRIIQTYYEIGSINHLGHCPLPSTDVVHEIASDLKEVLFPGYRRRQNLHAGNVGYMRLADACRQASDAARNPSGAFDARSIERIVEVAGDTRRADGS